MSYPARAEGLVNMGYIYGLFTIWLYTIYGLYTINTSIGLAYKYMYMVGVRISVKVCVDIAGIYVSMCMDEHVLKRELNGFERSPDFN